MNCGGLDGGVFGALLCLFGLAFAIGLLIGWQWGFARGKNESSQSDAEAK